MLKMNNFISSINLNFVVLTRKYEKLLFIYIAHYNIDNKLKYCANK